MQVTDTNHLKKKYFQYITFYRSMIFRVFILMCLLTIYIIPSNTLNLIINNEIEKQLKITDSLTSQWNSETIIGPVLSIPYVERISRIETQTDSNGLRSSISKDTFNNKTLILLPEKLHIEAELKNRIITKEKHTAHTYQGEVILTGNFNLELLPEPSAYNSIDWDKAIVAIGFNDNRGLDISSPLRWEGSSTNYKPGTGELAELLKDGLHVNIEDVANDNNAYPEFKIQLSLKGNEDFRFAPLGEITTAKIKSDSKEVNISGDISEDSKVNSKEGFEASWSITNLKRNYPQEWLITGDEEPIFPNLSDVLSGVKLIHPTDAINNLKKIKTLVFFIIPLLSLLFLSLLVLEYIPNNKIKPKLINYLIISLPILLMPVLTLTLSLSLSFIEAYIIAIIGILCTIIIYLLNSLRNVLHTMYVSSILTITYIFLFILVNMNHHLLLAAPIAGASIIFLLMMASTNLKEDL